MDERTKALDDPRDAGGVHGIGVRDPLSPKAQDSRDKGVKDELEVSGFDAMGEVAPVCLANLIGPSAHELAIGTLDKENAQRLAVSTDDLPLPLEHVPAKRSVLLHDTDRGWQGDGSQYFVFDGVEHVPQISKVGIEGRPCTGNGSTQGRNAHLLDSLPSIDGKEGLLYQALDKDTPPLTDVCWNGTELMETV